MADLFGVADAEKEALLGDVKGMIRYAYSQVPRHQQKRLGPSEIGNPCERHLALATMQEPFCNTPSDPLPSLFGTAMHAWLEEAARKHNEFLGRVRWITETRVGKRVPGTCDLYDIDTKTVLDYKCPGPSRFKSMVTHGPGPTYETQAHLYGYGYHELGIPVENVGIVFLPRAGMLSRARIWMEPFNEAKAIAALDRYDRIIDQCAELDVENDPEGYLKIPITPSHDCEYCAYWSPNPQSPLQCKGNQDDKEPMQ